MLDESYRKLGREALTNPDALERFVKATVEKLLTVDIAKQVEESIVPKIESVLLSRVQTPEIPRPQVRVAFGSDFKHNYFSLPDSPHNGVVLLIGDGCVMAAGHDFYVGRNGNFTFNVPSQYNPIFKAERVMVIWWS